MQRANKRVFTVFFIVCWMSAFWIGAGGSIYLMKGFGEGVDSFHWINIGILPILFGLVLAVYADSKYRIILAHLDD